MFSIDQFLWADRRLTSQNLFWKGIPYPYISLGFCTGSYRTKCMILTYSHTLRMDPGWRASSERRGVPSPTRLLVGFSTQPHASAGRGTFPKCIQAPDTQLHVQMLTLLMVRLQRSNERNNVCFDQFDNSFKSIVQETWRQSCAIVTNWHCLIIWSNWNLWEQYMI